MSTTNASATSTDPRRDARAIGSRAPYVPQIRLYQDWLGEQRGLRFANYDALWRWSVTDLDAFWQSIWDYFDLQSPTPHACRAGRSADARRDVVRGRAGQLCAAGVPPCRRRRMPPGCRRSSAATRSGAAPRAVLARAAPAGRVAGAASAGAGRAARRPRRGLPAQHPGGDGRVSGGGQHRRRLEHLRARHGHERGARPLQADRAQGADRLRRRALRRPRSRPHRRWSPSCARRCRRCGM